MYDVCSSEPCYNGGVCFGNHEYYTCNCVNATYTGHDCENGKYGDFVQQINNYTKQSSMTYI